MPNCKTIGHSSGTDCILLPGSCAFAVASTAGPSWQTYQRFPLVTNPTDKCLLPFIATPAITSPGNVPLDSTTKMTLTSYTWTCQDASCAAISVAKSSALTPITLSYSGSVWEAQPNSYSTVSSNTFSLLVSGTDGDGASQSATFGAYGLNVACPSNIGVTETSPIV